MLLLSRVAGKIDDSLAQLIEESEDAWVEIDAQVLLQTTVVRKTGPQSIAHSRRKGGQNPGEEHHDQEHHDEEPHGPSAEEEQHQSVDEEVHVPHQHEKPHDYHPDEDPLDLKGFARCIEAEMGHVSRCHMITSIESTSQEHCLGMAAENNADTFNFRPDNGKCLIVNCESADVKLMTRGEDQEVYWHVYSKWCPGGEDVQEREEEEEHAEDAAAADKIKELVAEQEAEHFEELAREARARYEAAREAEEEEEEEVKELEAVPE